MCGPDASDRCPSCGSDRGLCLCGASGTAKLRAEVEALRLDRADAAEERVRELEEALRPFASLDRPNEFRLPVAYADCVERARAALKGEP